MRIYYPINYEEPTPALPKGGSLNEAQYSLTTKRLTSNGCHPPLPSGGGVGFHSPSSLEVAQQGIADLKS